MGLFSCFKRKKDAEKNKDRIINYILDPALTYCKNIKCGIGSIMEVYLEAAVFVRALSPESIKETMREWNITNPEHAALKFVEHSALSHISQRAKQGGDVDSVHELYEAVVNTKYESGFISKAQYESKLSYGNRLKGAETTTEKTDKKMSENVKLWWVGERDEHGRKIPRMLSCSKKEATKFAEENGLNPPEQYIPVCDFEFQIWNSLVSTQRQRLEDVEKSCVRKHPPKACSEMHKKTEN